MTMSNISLLGFGFPGGYEWIILLILGLLIFGRRLPEVGRSVGKAIVEFKRGIKGIEGDIETESSGPPALEREQPPAPAEPAPRLAQEPPAGVVSRSEASEEPVEAGRPAESTGNEPDRDSG